MYWSVNHARGLSITLSKSAHIVFSFPLQTGFVIF